MSDELEHGEREAIDRWIAENKAQQCPPGPRPKAGHVGLGGPGTYRPLTEKQARLNGRKAK